MTHHRYTKARKTNLISEGQISFVEGFYGSNIFPVVSEYVSLLTQLL